MEKRASRSVNNDIFTIFAANFLKPRMKFTKHVATILLFLSVICSIASYGQVVVGGDGPDKP